MNKTFIIFLSVLLFSEFIESKPRYGYRFWRKFVGSSIESSEEDSFESCVDCTNIGSGYKNRNVISKNSHPNYRGPPPPGNQGQTESYQPIEKQSDNEGQLEGENGYRPSSKPTYNRFDRNELQGGGESNYNQRPFRPNVKQIPDNRRPYNDYGTNNKRKSASEIGDFGNGHDNKNTFNIHKKVIYIS